RGGGLLEPDPPVHALAPVSAPDPGSEGKRRARADPARGGHPQPGEPSGRLPLPHALPVRNRDLLPGGTEAHRLWQRPLCRLPPPAPPRAPGGGRRGASGPSTERLTPARVAKARAPHDAHSPD